MNKNIVLIGLLIVLGLLAHAQKKEVQIILLAGQSNMQGHGNFDELDIDIKKRIKKVGNRVLLSTSDKPNIKPKPLSYNNKVADKKFKFANHFGPELFIGLTLAETNPEQQFLLIKKAVGGTSLNGAWNPDWTEEKANLAETGEARKKLKLYNEHIINIKNNLKQLENQGKSYSILGLAWMQGESDTNTEIKAAAYRNNLRALIDAYRKDLNFPEMPVVIGQVNVLPRKYKEGPDVVRAAMEKVVENDYFTALVKTNTDLSWSDFPKHTDNLHYNTEGQKRLGTAFANALLDTAKKFDFGVFKDKNQLVPGITIRFRVQGETNISYNVYLPSTYSSNNLTPIIIAFSPNGNGDGILQKMKASAEEAGCILVGCDKLKNGLKDEALEIKMEDEVMNDILKNIPHETSQTYLAGFSGGAMRAYGLSTRRPEKYAGILAFGGWLGGDAYQDKKYQIGMRIAMVNGDNDHGANRWVEKDSLTLTNNNSVVKCFAFEGGHQIANDKTISEAIHWMINKNE